MCHPQSDAGGIEAIDVTATLGQGGEIELVYRVTGAIEVLKIADPAIPDRVDGLWKNTCFELFVGNSEDKSYLEYNFAPSGQWAAYAFTGYREGMTDLACAPPQINCTAGEGIFEMTVTVDLPESLRMVDVMAGFSAVIADNGGRIAYWALAHPPGKADFHHKDCFALQLEARSAA